MSSENKPNDTLPDAPQPQSAHAQPVEANNNKQTELRESQEDVKMELIDAGAFHDENAPLQCELWAFGRNAEGELGIGSSEDPQLIPRLVPSLSQRKVVQVACGFDHTAVLTDAGSIYTFGNNESGALGRDGRQLIPARLDILETVQVRSVSCGQGWTACLGSKGEIITWGSNESGQLGDGTVTSRARPRRVESLASYFFVQLRCGAKHAVALTAMGDVFTWGEGFSGQLGSGQFIRNPKPSMVADLAGLPVRKIAAGEEYTMVLTVSGDVWAFGSNKFGQLGVGDQRDRLRPTLLTALVEKRVTDVECGAQHTLFLTKQDRVYSVGAGSFGALGHDSTEHETSPKVILELLGSPVSSVACGRRHTLAVCPETERVTAFGAGARGQLGLGVAVPSKGLPTSVDVFKGRKVSAVYAGGESSFALIADYPVRRELAIARLTLKSVKDWITTNNMGALQRQIETVFSSFSCLNASFLDDSTVLGTSKTVHGIDLNSVREAYRLMFSHAPPSIIQTLGNCTARLVTRMRQIHYDQPETLRFILIILENPLLLNQAQYLPAIERLTEGILALPAPAMATLQQWWATLHPDFFSRTLQVLQSQLTFLANNAIDRPITQTVMVLEKLHHVNEHKRLIPYTRFYNEAISRRSDLEEDYKRFRGGAHIFSFCRYPFLLDPDAKSRILHIDAAYQQRAHFEQAVIQNLYAQQSTPFLVLTLRRDNLIGDTLNLIAQKMDDIKKPLKVIFIGEPAADEGGVAKEFFQLVVREIFDPNYGLFSFTPETGEYWFNPHSLESERQFELIGTVLGLAIYNGVILDVHFPLVVYKKLLGIRPTLDDLKRMQPVIGKGLQTLLDSQDDVEETFGLTFATSLDVFGEQKLHEFIPGGKDIPVTNNNRKDYVDAYVKYALTDSVAKQYNAFAAGFARLMSGPILALFRPEELEVLTTGTDELDFHQLEKVTQYKDYTKDSPVIKFFWEIVHDMNPGQRRDLLRFSTGCVRAPILGLGSMPFIIQRSGPDSERLPAAHTCFNILDLPEYSSKEKLREKLLIAISNAEGFGLQ